MAKYNKPCVRFYVGLELKIVRIALADMIKSKARKYTPAHQMKMIELYHKAAGKEVAGD